MSQKLPERILSNTYYFAQVDIILSPVATYLVDVLKTRNVEAMAVYTSVHHLSFVNLPLIFLTSASRSLFCAITSAGVWRGTTKEDG